MILEKKIEALKKAANSIMENGDTFTLQKSFDSIDIDLINEERAQKIYKTRSILRRYSNKSLSFWSLTYVILFLLLISLFVMISTGYISRKVNIDSSFINNIFVYSGLLIIFFYIIIKIKKQFQRIYLWFKWKDIHFEFKMINIDSSFLQNQFGSYEEYLDTVNILSDKLAEEEIKKYKYKYNG